MEQEFLEMSAKTVEEAIELALLELGAGRDEVEVNVISKGRTGILGIGSEPARVKVSRITGETGSAAPAIEIIARLLKLLEVEAQPTIRRSGSGPDDPSIIDIQGNDSGLLIGRRGETLHAIQFIVNMLLSHQQEERTMVTVDVEQYKERRRQKLRSLANRTADRVVANRRSITLEPMSAGDRRIIHITLADHKSVVTESSGQGLSRQVTILPREGA